MIRMILTFLIALLASCNVVAQLRDNAAARVDSLLMEWDHQDMPGLAVAVVRDGKVLLKKTAGMANLEYKIPIMANTVFTVASISKQFTAYAIAQLVIQERLGLEDEVHQYIPELPDYGHPITIFNLLTHTSGLKDQYDLLYLAGWKPEDVISNADALELIYRQQSLNFEPGTAYQYSNSGYTLLALIIERVTHQPFASWCREHIFLPAKIDHAFFITDFRQLVANRAESYTVTETGFARSPIQSTTNGPNGLHATLDDLVAWAVFLMDSGRLNDRMRGMIENVPHMSGKTDSLQLFYGFGQAITQYRGEKLIWHDGSDAGYRSYVGRFPDQHTAIIVLGNQERIDPKNMAMQVADAVLADQLDASSPTVPAPQKNIAPVSVEEAIEGQYVLPAGQQLEVFVIDHNIYARFAGADRFQLFPQGKDKFINTEQAVTLYYQKQGNEDIIAWQMGNSEPVPIQQLTDIDLSAFEEYLGTYRCGDLGVTYVLVHRGNRMGLMQPRNTFIPLKQVAGDEFASGYWWLKQVQFRRDTGHAIVGFDINNSRAKGLRFEKVDTPRIN